VAIARYFERDFSRDRRAATPHRNRSLGECMIERPIEGDDEFVALGLW